MISKKLSKHFRDNVPSIIDGRTLAEQCQDEQRARDAHALAVLKSEAPKRRRLKELIAAQIDDLSTDDDDGETLGSVDSYSSSSTIPLPTTPSVSPVTPPSRRRVVDPPAVKQKAVFHQPFPVQPANALPAFRAPRPAPRPVPTADPHQANKLHQLAGAALEAAHSASVAVRDSKRSNKVSLPPVTTTTTVDITNPHASREVPEKLKRYRTWCGTGNNYTEESYQALLALDCKHLVVGKEVGASGTPHLQFCITFTSAISFATCKDRIPGCHLSRALMVPQAIEYCKKEGNFFERGDPPIDAIAKGKMEKERWSNALANAQSGMFHLIPPQIQVMQCRNLAYLRNNYLANQSLIDTEFKMVWLWGPTGTGKSRFARETWPGLYHKLCNKWWCNYKNEPVVLIEDFDKLHEVLVHHLKIWADRYPFSSEVKCGMIRIRPRLIVVTSNYHPSDIWFNDESIGPIMRRFQVVWFGAGEIPTGKEATKRCFWGVPSVSCPVVNHQPFSDVGTVDQVVNEEEQTTIVRDVSIECESESEDEL